MTPTDKPALRARMRAERKRLAALDPRAAARAADHADDLPHADVIALYRAVGSELDAGPLWRALTRRGRTLCLPVVIRPDTALIFRRWSPGDPLTPDAAGVPAPLASAPRVTPDLILTPLLAFDAWGGRLGQGGGYYDRTFAEMPDATRIGFAYAGQVVDDLPTDPHDSRLHGVLSEAGYRAIP